MQIYLKPEPDYTIDIFKYTFKCASCLNEIIIPIIKKNIKDIKGYILSCKCEKCNMEYRFAFSGNENGVPILGISYNSPYKIIDPTEKEFWPGNLVIVTKEYIIPKLIEIEKKETVREYNVKVYLSDHLPVTGNIESVIESKCSNEIILEQRDNPCSIHFMRGNSAVYLDLYKTDSIPPKLDYIAFKVSSSLPKKVFPPVRTLINHFLTSLSKFSLMPLMISKIELYIPEVKQPLLYEIIHPFNPVVLPFQSGSGLDSFPFFYKFRILLLESINSLSPYYRLLTAYKLFNDGIPNIRSELQRIKDHLKINEQLPKRTDTIINRDELKRLGFSAEITDVKDLNELFLKFKILKNAVSHLFLEDKNKQNKKESTRESFDFSDGLIYNHYTIASLMLLKYVIKEYYNYENYFSRYVNPIISKGQVLPLLQNKDKYKLDCEAYWQTIQQSDKKKE